MVAQPVLFAFKLTVIAKQSLSSARQTLEIVKQYAFTKSQAGIGNYVKTIEM